MLSGEEKIDLKIVQRLVNFFLLQFLLSDFSFAQIPINGFTNFSDIDFIPEQNRIFSLNFNKDSYSDFLVYKVESKTAYLLTGQPNLQFAKALKINFRYEPNFFKPIYDIQNQIKEYAFTSRKSRIFGLMSFNQFGYPRISKSIELNSFPNKIDFADIDLDLSNEFLISGQAFEGLSIIFDKNNQLVEKKLFKNHSFLDAYFFNINGDEYVDILAYDLISEKLMFIYNKDGERFAFERELQINQKVNKFQIQDLNFDGNKDLIFSTNFGLLLYFGDPLSLFNQSTQIKTSASINNFTIGDYNHDGSFDFICHSSEKNYLSIIFSKDENEFYKEIIFESGKEINDLIPFFSRFVYGISYLTAEGKIKIVSEFRTFNKDANFIYGVEPYSLKTFDFTNNGLSDFVFLDAFDNRLKFILRNNQGVPTSYFYVDLKGVHSEIFILRKSENQSRIYCYSKNDRLIEIVEVDFSNYSFNREILYTEGKIQDLWIENVNGNTEIKVLYSANNNLNYGIYKLSLDKKYKLIKYPQVSENFQIASILSENEDKLILAKRSDSLFIIKSVIYLFDNKISDTIFSDYLKDVTGIYNCIQKQVKNYNYFSSLIQTVDKKYFLIFSPDFKILINSDLLTDYSLPERNPLVSDDEGFVYFFDTQLNKIFNIIYVKRPNKILLKNVYDRINLSEFIVTRLDKTNKHIIFIDKTDNKIKTRQLN